VEGTVDAESWIAITNAICNTVQIVALAWIGSSLQADRNERRRT
jgi:hypothetical protein